MNDKHNMLAIPRMQASSMIEERITKGSEIRLKSVDGATGLVQLKSEWYSWDEYNREMLRQMFTTSEIADEYSASGGFFIAGDYSFSKEVNDFYNDIDNDLRKLSSIRDRLELIPMVPTVSLQGSTNMAASTIDKSVFIVHGHDEAALHTVARFIERLALDPVVLHEKPSKGRTIVEKLEAHSHVRFAVVLLTSDDVGGVDQKHLKPRARQNVVLELGFFLARLGRENVIALYKGELEMPSDYMGVVYVPFDAAGAWKLTLARELKAAGIDVDMNRAIT